MGNIEPQELVKGTADVIVADGFVGNVAIKMGEASIDMLLGVMREEIPRTFSGKLGGLLMRPGIQRIRGKLDWRRVGGAPLLGIDGVAVVAHGRSDARAIRNAVRVAAQAVKVGLVEKSREAVSWTRPRSQRKREALREAAGGGYRDGHRQPGRQQPVQGVAGAH